MSVNEFRERFQSAVLSFLWRQWCSLGVSGHLQSSALQPRYVLDPEALLIFSAYCCRQEPRLYDLVIDWLRKNGSFVSMQRLKTLAKRYVWCDSASVGFMAACAVTAGDRRWKKLSEEMHLSEKNCAREPTALFSLSDGTQNDFWGSHPDETALRYGFQRSCYRPSEKVADFPLRNCAVFLLQLRGAFGLSARAETILVLLNHESCRVSELVDKTSFSWKSLQDVLEELCASAIVASIATKGRGQHFFLRNPKALLALFDQRNAVFPDWVRIFDFLGGLWKMMSRPELSRVSRETFRSEVGRFFEEKIHDDLLKIGLPEWKMLGADTLEEVVPLLEKL